LSDCEQLLAGLNPAQAEAAAHLEGPCLVLAGAGSGKTRVLTHRIAYLVCRGVDPASILAITFTNKAAREMRERVEQLLGRGAAGAMVLSTFHAACVRILRRWGDRLGWDPRFLIADDADQRALLKACIQELNLDPQRYNPSAVRAAIDRAKNDLVGPEEMARRADGFYAAQVARIYELYQRRLREQNTMDFGDLLAECVRLLREHPEVLEALQERFHYVLVDEYQDTNHAQYVWLRLLCGRRRNLFAVGDADQSIYGWRGADISNILRFEEDFPEARVVLLEQNYRSTQPILDAAHDVIAHNRQRREKRLWTDRTEGPPVVLYRAREERDEAQFVAAEMERLHAEEGVPWSECAVLYRTHAQSRVLEEVLVRRGIPYVIVGGLRFYERKEVKDLLAYLRLVVNPYDRLAYERVVNEPRRGLGPAALLKIDDHARRLGLSPVHACADAAAIPGLTRPQAEAAAAFGRLILDLAEQRRSLPVGAVLERLAEDSGYARMLREEGTIEAAGRLENLQELFNIAAEFTAAGFDDTPEDFLAHVALTAEADTAVQDDAVSLMTLHSAKGLEFDVVFLVGMEEGLFPHVRSLDDAAGLEEERRLCYVGMTRARRRLYLTHAWYRTVYGDFQPGIPSRFLSEIRPGRLEERGAVLADEDLGRPPAAGRGWGRAAAPTAAAPGGAGPGDGAGETYVPRAGEKVIHPKWGEGTVVSLRGSGLDAEVAVVFPEPVGLKRLLVRYARLARPG